MRVSSNQMQQVAINAMLEQQSQLSKVQQQVASGKKISKPSDDPVATAKAVKLNDILTTADQYQANIVTARARISLEEGVLGEVTKVYHRVRELAIQANNASQTNETRRFISSEVEQLLEELLGLANSSDSTGEFLFAGNKGKFKPFARNNHGGFDYKGDDGHRSIQIGPRRLLAVGDSGSDVFREIRDGNGQFAILESPNNKGSGVVDPGAKAGNYDLRTYAIIFDKKESIDPNEPVTYSVIDSKGQTITPPGQIYKEGAAIEFRGVHTFLKGNPAAGDFFVVRPSFNQDIFTSINHFVEELRKGRNSEADHAALSNNINRLIVAMDVSLGKILEVRANVGARLNALDSQESTNDAVKIQVQEILSNVQDLDYSQAVSELNLKLTGLQASQKAFTRIQGISLFDYL